MSPSPSLFFFPFVAEQKLMSFFFLVQLGTFGRAKAKVDELQRVIAESRRVRRGCLVSIIARSLHLSLLEA